MIDSSRLVSAGNNLSYLLTSSEVFSSTAHRMMQGMLENGFLTCVAYRYDGAVKLMYLAEDKKPISALSSLNDARMLDIVDSLAETAEQIASAGFLSLDNIAVSPDTVFANAESGSCYFICLPINGRGAGAGKEAFEKRVLDLINGLMVRWGTSPNLRRLAVEASRDGASLRSIRQVISQLRSLVRPGPSSGPGPYAGSIPTLHLVGVNTPVPVDIALSKPEFIIGSNVNGVDGTVSFSRAISRIHCKLYIVGSDIFIADMGSMNGTYVNGQKLQEGQKTSVNIGDRIRLATSEFEIRRD